MAETWTRTHDTAGWIELAACYRLAERATALLEESAPVDYVSHDAQLADGRTIKAKSLDELERDLIGVGDGDVRTLTLYQSNSSKLTARLSRHAWGGTPETSIMIKGENRTAVEGIRVQLAELLDQRQAERQAAESAAAEKAAAEKAAAEKVAAEKVPAHGAPVDSPSQSPGSQNPWLVTIVGGLIVGVIILVLTLILT